MTCKIFHLQKQNKRNILFELRYDTELLRNENKNISQLNVSFRLSFHRNFFSGNKHRERERKREHMPSDSYNGKAWPDRREAATICATQSCCGSSMPWSARSDAAARGEDRRRQTRGGARSRKMTRLLNPRLGLGFITLVIWDLDPKTHIQSETHLSSPNNG
ncbi:hypothetical protein PRUPE_1G231800 [Prunus persica]|uniref:Uncharacterized protein n=1 Tax=Prunus persica TaxID=3760 RepID=A0A251R279_PRUPE|nr:hypothetical protein PRUPE_1G231800 [Prunus persica]